MIKSFYYSRYYIIRFFFYIVTCFLFVEIHSISFASSQWYTGDIRLKHEYQHFILKNSGKYIVTVKKEKKSKIPKFCFEDPQKNKKSAIFQQEIDKDAIKLFLREKIAPEINQKVSHVKITKNPENSQIQFEGYGYDGITLDIDASAEIVAYAIKNKISQLTLAVKRTPAQVIVEDEELKKMGIKELISVGRSNFYPSSRKRIQNIMAGASRFNGFIIKPGEEFSFNTQLGKVDGTTGYAQEYVILGPKVLKEYGGGLCQVSSTAYRGAMLAGLKITERHNHSFAVNHYKPYGSDATIYQGVKDFRFKNDTKNAILLQTRRGGKNNSELFFHYYGTKPNREVKIFGPTIKNRKPALPPKITYSSALPEGTSQKVSGAVRGFDASFGRIVIDKNSQKNIYTDRHFSHYQARGNWIIRGGTDPALSSQEISRPEFVEPL